MQLNTSRSRVSQPEPLASFAQRRPLTRNKSTAQQRIVSHCSSLDLAARTQCKSTARNVSSHTAARSTSQPGHDTRAPHHDASSRTAAPSASPSRHDASAPHRDPSPRIAAPSASPSQHDARAPHRNATLHIASSPCKPFASLLRQCNSSLEGNSSRGTSRSLYPTAQPCPRLLLLTLPRFTATLFPKLALLASKRYFCLNL